MSLNPYAPPVESDSVREAPKSSGWEMRDGQLRVESGATLPMIDPFSGESAEQMTMIRIALRRRIRWHIYLFMVGLGLLAVPGMGADYVSIIVVTMILGLIAGLAMSAFSPVAFVQVFLTKQTLRWQRVQRFWGIVLLGLAIAVLFFGSFVNVRPGSGYWFAMVVGGGFFLLLLSAVIVRQLGRKLYHRGRKDGVFEIGGVHPKALGELGSMRVGAAS